MNKTQQISPQTLRSSSLEELKEVCKVLRQRIVEAVSQNGGHLSASLGAAELAVGLHNVFNTPTDKLIWDVGHQSYPHKLITGRSEQFDTLRKQHGVSGFPKISESEYDAFGTGHSSTSISAALGMAVAAHNKQQQFVAVIGDGALTGGMAFEALNHASTLKVNLKIILNDNSMSIDENVGKLNETGNYKAFFEALGLTYFGAVNGNNLEELLPALEQLKNHQGVAVLHAKTIKGFGYQPSEDGDKIFWHAPGKFDPTTGVEHSNTKATPPKYQDVFGETLLELAKENPNIVAVTPAMLSGSSLKLMQQEFPERVFDVGIAEQHAVTFSAGMATQGKKVYCHIYSTFLQRGYDQLIHDVAVQNLPIVFCIDRAGFVGEDGATHHGLFDVAYLRCIPNLIVAAPIDEEELRNLLYTAQFVTQPIAIRFPRGKGNRMDWKQPLKKLEIGKADIRQNGKETAILSFGTIGQEAYGIEGITHVNMRFAKPLDEALLHQICKTHTHIITLEEATKIGGFGSAVAEFMAAHHYTNKLTILGVDDAFVEHATPQQQREESGLTRKKLDDVIIG
jgi:1-deoxy-D-xylulose-5-phosphate synthase